MLKTIMAMFGLFGSYTDKDNIRLYSIDEIYEQKPQAKDWTNRVITGSKIDSISFSLENFAQKNWLRYLKDETVITYADHFLEVDNDTIDSEKDLYEMKFAASDDSFIGLIRDNPIAYFPMYTVEGFDNAGYPLEDNNGYPILNYEKISNRICKIENYEQVNEPLATFPTELQFNELIGSFYSYYQKIVLRPKVVEASLKLTDLDIHTIDLMTPIYLEQTGNYYIIIDLQINGNNIAKAKLLQM